METNVLRSSQIISDPVNAADLIVSMGISLVCDRNRDLFCSSQ